MPRRAFRSYPTKDATDLTDEQWAAIAPLVTTPSPNGGCPTDIDRRAIVNALRSKHRTGCQWRMLLNDVPPMRSVRSSFDKWNRDGTVIKVNDTLRKLARHALERDPEPSISVLDAQSVKTTEAGGERGYDEKKVNGRKRQFWADTNGFLVRMLVHPADISDTEGAEWLLAAHHHSFPQMREMRVDEGYKKGLDEWLRQNTAMRLNVIEKPPRQTGCAVIPKRRVVERSIAWAGHNRLASKEYNRNPESSEAFLYLGSIAMLLKRLYPRCSFLIALLVFSVAFFPTDACSCPEAVIRPCSYGTAKPVGACAPWRGILIGCAASPSLPTGRPWPRGRRTAPSGCGG